MSEINVEARDRYYAEVSLKLSKAGFAPQPQEGGYLPVDWNGSRLCRLTANGGVQYREEHMERSGGREALDRVIDIAGTTAEYMRCMESASVLHAEKLGGGYTLLSESDFPIIDMATHRLRNAVVEHGSFERVIRHYDRPSSFFYCDPPYHTTEDFYKNVGGFDVADGRITPLVSLCLALCRIRFIFRRAALGLGRFVLRPGLFLGSTPTAGLFTIRARVFIRGRRPGRLICLVRGVMALRHFAGYINDLSIRFSRLTLGLLGGGRLFRLAVGNRVSQIFRL